LNESRLVNYRLASIDELRAVRDAVKIIEHLARYKNKPAGGAATSSPAARPAPPAGIPVTTTPNASRSPAASLSQLGEEFEEATKVNMIPEAATRPAAAAVARPTSAPPVAKPATLPARPAITAAAPRRPAQSDDRTVVGQLPPAAKDEDADFTSIIDKLGE
jgi:hypothetical protein